MESEFKVGRSVWPSKAPVLALACIVAAGWPNGLMANSAPEAGDASKPAMSEQSTPVVDMRHVERVKIRVWGNAELSGDYSIDHNSSLSFPGLGRIDVGTMTPAELEKELANRLGALTRTSVTVSVDVEQFRPFFIMGHVAEPGAIAWRPGLKVIQAVTLARGVSRSADATDTGAQQDRLVAHQQSETRLTVALAQLARYRAEREGGDAVAANRRIATLISRVPEGNRAALTGLMDRQNVMLSEQRDVLQTQMIGLQREREAAEREREAAEQQERAVLKQLEMTREFLADVESLWKRKLISRTRLLDQRTQLLTAEVRYSEARSLVERARVRLSAVDQQIVMLPQQRRLSLNERIDELEREVAHLELSSATREDSNDALTMVYHITRESDGGVQTIAANIFTEVFPGDVLIVADGRGRAVEKQPVGFSKSTDAPAEIAPQPARHGALEGKAAPKRVLSSAEHIKSY